MRGPKIDPRVRFEDVYTEKFRSLIGPYGTIVKHEKDRAAIDIGLHLVEPAENGFSRHTHTRVWFQLKGKSQSSLSLDQYNALSNVGVSVRREDLRFWYVSPEAVYLVVYVECADVFLAQDVREIVDAVWGERILDEQTFPADQGTVTVRISKSYAVDEKFLKRLARHRSIRADGPQFRGRPLGHSVDPRRSLLARMDPSVFHALMLRLLSAHGFLSKEAMSPSYLFPDNSVDDFTLLIGVMRYTYEWTMHLTTEFGQSVDSELRIDGDLYTHQGPCAVFIHSRTETLPDWHGIKRLMADLKCSLGITTLLVMANMEDDPAYFGTFFSAARESKIHCIPQQLGDLAFNILTTTSVYLDFRGQIRWRCLNYL